MIDKNSSRLSAFPSYRSKSTSLRNVSYEIKNEPRSRSSPRHTSMSTLLLPCRCYRVLTDADVPCDEWNFGYIERELPIHVAQAALVLVDVWNIDYIESYFQRIRSITRDKIAPVLDTARALGMAVIHAPSPEVADRYAPAPPQPSPSSPTAAWPPVEFIPHESSQCRQGEYSIYGRDAEPRLQAALERFARELDVAPEVRPLEGEPVIHTGQQLHEVLAQRQILHLFYAGFATNWCIMNRDYGVVEMSKRGYNIILLRDATTGIETHDTVRELTLTRGSIREIETKYAWSTETQDLLKAAR
jgi:nicotinamidase-related amidase